MMKQRKDLFFIFLTKRIERLAEVLPMDWEQGYDNVLIGCTIENQESANKRLEQFIQLPIKHKNIICQPLLEKISIEKYLTKDIHVIVGGEYGKDARIFNFEWALDIRRQCINKKTTFELRQLGTHFIKDNKQYKLAYKELSSQAKKAKINIGKDYYL